MKVSGVDYYLPRDTGTGLSTAQLQVDAAGDDFWINSYRTDDRPLSGSLGDTPPALMSSSNPAFIGISPFAYEDGTYSVPTGAAGSFYTASDYFVRKHRIEIPFTHLNGTGFFDDANGPTLADTFEIAGASYSNILLDGDPTEPAFSSEAVPRLYLRRPFNNVAGVLIHAVQPANLATVWGQGQELSAAAKTLYHSTSFEPINTVGSFGNFRTAGVAPQPTYPQLVSAARDVEERFLDEVYRHGLAPLGPAGALDALYAGPVEAAINGPGLGAWVASPVEVPVQVGIVPSPSVWQASSVLQTDAFAALLANGAGWVGQALQVAGLPDRNPFVATGQAVLFPSAGVCLYPHKNYSVTYVPAGPNYTTLTGTRQYVRCFDASFGGTVAAAGQPFFTIRIDGLQLQDYEYTAPGPGTLNATEGIAIFVKVPGLTGWLDLGRTDGGGPSKQDPLLDGAGCRVVGPDTFDGVDTVTQMVYSQVRVNVGPVANLFAMVGFGGASGIDASEVGKVPVLVMVRMDPQAANFDLEQEYDPNTRTFGGVNGAGHSPRDIRGLTGLRLVSP
jgi:hypothetical protein